MIGERVPNVDALAKATGEAIYTADMHLPGMLVGKILRSPFSHGRILNIDTSKAKRLTGVRAVITAKDIPRVKFGMGSFLDQLVLQDTNVRYIGDEIAAVAAINEDTANEALQLITYEIEQIPAVYDPEIAMRSDSIKIHDGINNNISVCADLSCGNVEEAFQNADVIVEDSFTTPSQSHVCLEVHSVIAKWDSTNRVTVWASTQSPHMLKERLARVCRMAPSQIRVIKPYVGGAFGSKTNMTPMEPIAVFLAKSASQPVKIINTREEEFYTVYPRHATSTTLRFGFTRDGNLIAKQARVVMDNGAYNTTGPAILAYNCIMFSALYRCPNVNYQGHLVYTNKLPNGSFRGFGTYQAMFGHEIMMDKGAEKLKMDPKDLRLINANLPNEKTANGVQITSCGLKETIQSACEKARWNDKRKLRRKGFGIGMASIIHTGASSNIFGANYSGATLRLNIDGSVNLNTGASDIGQGSNTVLLQIAAETLGIGINDIRLEQGDTDITPPDVGTKGSRCTFVSGLAVLNASKNIRSAILDAAARMLKTESIKLTISNGSVFVLGSSSGGIPFSEIAKYAFAEENVLIEGNGVYNQGIGDSNPITGFGYEAPAMIFATQIAEVQVDEETGFVNVLNVTSAHDIGRVINKALAEGQVEGGVAQGIGGALTEKIEFFKGKCLNGDLTDYKVLSSMETPNVDCLWIEKNDPTGPYGSKGIAEACNIPTAPAIANAIYDAIGIRLTDLPITAEKIVSAISKNKNSQAR